MVSTVARGQRSFDEADIPAPKRAYALRDEGFLVEQARQHSDVVGAHACSDALVSCADDVVTDDAGEVPGGALAPGDWPGPSRCIR